MAWISKVSANIFKKHGCGCWMASYRLYVCFALELCASMHRSSTLTLPTGPCSPILDLQDVFLTSLAYVTEHVLPIMTQPLLLADAYTSAYEHGTCSKHPLSRGCHRFDWVATGGVVSVHALSGLFLLITKHNLDYPRYFDKLYALISPETTHAKYRSKFFNLLEASLNTAHLPSYLVASFVKRMGRVAVLSPPPAAVFLVSLGYNILKAHPACVPLIHRDLKVDKEADMKQWVAELMEESGRRWAADAPRGGKDDFKVIPIAKESNFRQDRPATESVAQWVAELLGTSASRDYVAPATAAADGGAGERKESLEEAADEEGVLEAAVQRGLDVYKDDVKPAKSRALHSSLWELSVGHHPLMLCTF